jgi:hypothetical protein
MNDKCVVCGKDIPDFYVGIGDCCSHYCLGIKEGRKQGVVEELEKISMSAILAKDYQTKKYIENRLKELRKEFEQQRKQGAIEVYNWLLSLKVPKPLIARTLNNEEIIFVYVKDIKKRLKELKEKGV